MTTWFGGIDGSPSALRVSDSTITMRVKLVSMTRSAGATARTVSSKMMTMLCAGFLFPLLSVAPKSMLTDASLPAVVGVLTLGTVGVDGGVSAGAVTDGTGSAPAAVTDALSQPQATAAAGSRVTTRARRNQTRRREPDGVGP